MISFKFTVVLYNAHRKNMSSLLNNCFMKYRKIILAIGKFVNTLKIIYKNV